MKKRLTITGAFGLLGSNICNVLERDYPEISISKIKCDFVDFDLNSSDYVVHAAGYGQPQMFAKDKLKTIEINTVDTSRLFQCLKPNGKFLFVSTSEVYSGATPPHTEDMIGTTTPQHPRACYIEGKRCGEAICMAYREQRIDVKIARLALAYGPGTKPHDTRVLNELIEKALTTGEIVLKDSGDALRTYCYVEDAAEMMLDILFKGSQPVYNVGGMSNTSILELAQIIGKITGAKVIKGEGSSFIRGAPNNVGVNMTRTLYEFPRKFVQLEEGLKRTIAYQKTLYGK